MSEAPDPKLKEFMEVCKKCKDLIEEKEALAEKHGAEMKALNAKLNEAKHQVLKGLEAGELQRIQIPGWGTLFSKRKQSVKVPKTIEDKQLLFDWIRKTKGEDVLMGYLSIHSGSLNTFFNAERKIALDEAKKNNQVIDIDEFRLPGIEAPKEWIELGHKRG